MWENFCIDFPSSHLSSPFWSNVDPSFVCAAQQQAIDQFYVSGQHFAAEVFSLSTVCQLSAVQLVTLSSMTSLLWMTTKPCLLPQSSIQCCLLLSIQRSTHVHLLQRDRQHPRCFLSRLIFPWLLPSSHKNAPTRPRPPPQSTEPSPPSTPSKPSMPNT